MKMKNIIAMAGLLAFVGTAAAQTTPRPKQLAPDFDVLTKKSIFSRDRVIRTGNNGNGRTGRTRPVQPPRNYIPIYIGALLGDDGSFVAFIADPESGQMQTFRTGDALPNSGGTIKDITLDDMTATLADKTSRKITIGQTILGTSAEYPSAASPPAPPPDAPKAAAATGAAPATPSDSADAGSGDTSAAPSAGGPSAGGPSGRLPGESMLDFFKRRRAQQTGGK